MLIVFGGLPGTGKTTISRALAERLSATWLRIDLIEHAIRSGLCADDVGTAGYSVANALAEANLSNGQTVVVDCVNPAALSRIGWKAVAERSSCALMQIEVVCADRAEHRRRVERRIPDILGHVLPTWQDVLNYAYEAWNADFVLDSSRLSAEEAVVGLLGEIELRKKS